MIAHDTQFPTRVTVVLFMTDFHMHSHVKIIDILRLIACKISWYPMLLLLFVRYLYLPLKLKHEALMTKRRLLYNN